MYRDDAYVRQGHEQKEQRMTVPEESLMAHIERSSTPEDIIHAARHLNQTYSPFATDAVLWKEVKTAFSPQQEQLFNGYSEKLIANKFINLLLLKYYPCERTIKYALIERLNKKLDTVLFEMPVLTSRIDVGRINGNSFAYEIKTEFDSLRRIEKQISDYSRVYEYIIVIVAPLFYEEVSKLLPDHCGIWTYSHTRSTGSTTFTRKRPEQRSPYLCPHSQLQCLSQHSLHTILKNKNIKDSSIPATKEERIALIMDVYAPRTINTKFKAMVKEMYASNWKFIHDNYHAILPIDIQAIFGSTIDPDLLYLKQ